MLSGVAFLAIAIVPFFHTEFLAPSGTMDGLLKPLLAYACVAALSVAYSRTYRTIWRYVSFQDLLSLIKAATLTLVGFVGLEFFTSSWSAPRAGSLVSEALLLLLWLANVAFLAAPRLLARAISEARNLNWHRGGHPDGAPIPALISGDLERMEAFIRESARSPSSRHRIVGVLTEDDSLHGSYLHGVPVLEDIQHLDGALFQLREKGIRPETLILARDNATRKDFEHLLELSGPIGIKVGRLPPHGTFQDATTVEPLELADLLGRPEVVVDSTAIAAMIHGKCVLITGAGGSIGGELSRQIARLAPAKIIVADSCEFNLYTIDKELEEIHPGLPREAALLDVRDGELVGRWIERFRPEIVFHAAALKHVPLLEDHPIEAIKTNVIGTVNVAEACHKFGVATMVTISTDKAVNPTNVMGATKRLAEAYCQGLDQAFGRSTPTRFITVRFGNVLGSAGSVVPLFQRQIEAGGPVTVTHPEITRFFMTIPEAVSLVLQAGAQGIGLDEDRGVIYVLEMGQPVKIMDLARQMIQLSGQRPDVDIKIEVIGLRPGEKLYEEVMHSDEAIIATRSKKILKLAPRATDLRIMRQQVLELRQACTNNEVERVRRVLKFSVPEYRNDSDLAAALP